MINKISKIIWGWCLYC